MVQASYASSALLNMGMFWIEACVNFPGLGANWYWQVVLFQHAQLKVSVCVCL